MAENGSASAPPFPDEGGNSNERGHGEEANAVHQRLLGRPRRERDKQPSRMVHRNPRNRHIDKRHRGVPPGWIAWPVEINAEPDQDESRSVDRSAGGKPDSDDSRDGAIRGH